MSSEYRCLSHFDICSGDQFRVSFHATQRCNRASIASLQALGRCARVHVAASASVALYLVVPPFRATSREIVDGDRCKRAAMLRIDSALPSPREISSRSDNVSDVVRRVRTGGENPPLAATYPNTEPGGLDSARAMSLSVWPARHLFHSSAFSAAHNPRLRICILHHFPLW